MFSRPHARLNPSSHLTHFTPFWSVQVNCHHRATNFRGFSQRAFVRDAQFSHRREYHRATSTLQAASWTGIAGAAVVGSIVALVSITYHYTAASTIERTEVSREIQEPLPNVEMLAEATPGHLGNLTEEQEVKLREFWSATLKVFGVDPPAPTESSASTSIEDAASIDTPDDTASSIADGDKKKSKKRLGIFRSKKSGKESATANSEANTANTPSATAAEDDKYGQTKEFQNVLATQSPEDLRTAFWSMVKGDHPDGLLLRFLRARKWDIEKALIMLVATMGWRGKEVHVDDDIVANGEPAALEAAQSSDKAKGKEGEDFLAQMRLGKSFLHGTDKDGRPLCHVRVRLHKQGEQSESSLERFTVYTIETARLLLVPPVETACIIFDMSGFTLANMDYAPVKFMIKCFEANYPESLGTVLVHKAPWIFQGIWNIIKGWLDPVVASKIHFTKSVDDLEEYIERSHIIKELGGEDNWEYKYVEPKIPDEKPAAELDPNAKVRRDQLLEDRAGTVLEFQKKTFEWIATGTGSKATALKQERDALAQQLRGGYWDLDPLLRARTYYDRTGIISSGGKIDFYPERTQAVAKASTTDDTSADDVD